MNVEELTIQGEALHQALGREAYLTGAGLKTPPEFQAIYERFAPVASDDALAAARATGSMALLQWVVDVRVGRRVASLDERQLAWEQEAHLVVGDDRIPYLRAPIDLANAPDRAFRVELDRARASVAAAGLNELRAERFAEEWDELAKLALGSYVDARSALSEIDLDALGRQAQAFLAETADLYVDSLTRLVRRRLQLDVGSLERADAPWAFRANEFDPVFEPGNLEVTAARQAREMGLDLRQGGRVRLDTVERPGKQPRAFCAPVRVPDEVYLVLRPRGGHADYRTFWHELGHATHFASMDPDLSFAARWLGDDSVTEAFAMLWDHMTLDSSWLARYCGIRGREANDLLFETCVGELLIVRRYAAKLLYELSLHRGDLADMSREYAERLTDATRFRYLEDDYLIDVDPAFYSARYLRAWQLEASLAAELRRRFDEDWYRNPHAGAYVQNLMSQGQADPAHRLALEATGTDLCFDPLVQRIEEHLN